MCALRLETITLSQNIVHKLHSETAPHCGKVVALNKLLEKSQI
jgi:hypothetical protein